MLFAISPADRRAQRSCLVAGGPANSLSGSRSVERPSKTSSPGLGGVALAKLIDPRVALAPPVSPFGPDDGRASATQKMILRATRIAGNGRQTTIRNADGPPVKAEATSAGLFAIARFD